MEAILGEVRRSLAKWPSAGGSSDGGSQQESAGFEFPVAELPGKSDRALSSIVVLTHNQLSFTRQCVESVLNCTNERFEWIFVDNGSADGTVEYLRSLPNATLIENSANLGVPAGFNQGIRASRGKYVVLLNNDVVVTRGWLRRLLAALERDHRIGLVGPCFTWPDCAQSIAVPYRDLTGLEAFGRDWAEQHKGQVERVPDLVGACLLIRREVIDRIGFFDEDFGIGQCEDNDYCRRAVEAGFHCVIARDAFVHHFGHRTFFGSHIDPMALLKTNQRLLQDKTRQREIAAHRAPPSDLAGLQAQPEEETSPEGQTSSPIVSPDVQSFETSRIATVEKPLWGLTSIVILTRNQLPYTQMCLQSIRDRTDEPYELIVVDNGSTDGTVEFLRSQAGVRLIENPDNRGFPAGCNQGIDAAEGEHVLLLNNDTIVTTGWLDRLLRVLYSDPQIGLVGPCANNISGANRCQPLTATLTALTASRRSGERRTLGRSRRQIG